MRQPPFAGELMSTDGKKMPSLDYLNGLRCFHENPRDEAWTSHARHFFIITDSSRPVYCRYGNEVNVTPLLCTIVAFTGQLVRDGKELESLVAGDKVFVFYLPFPFMFVAVSSANVPVSLLLKELRMLEAVMFSVLSPMISTQVKRRPSFDIRKQSFTMERMFTSALHLMDYSHSFVFHECVPMAALMRNRERFASAIQEQRDRSVMAVVIFHRRDVFLTVTGAAFRLTTF